MKVRLDGQELLKSLKALPWVSSVDSANGSTEIMVDHAQSRIPEVMAKSGARLVEVGATNRTHLQDYERAISEETALLLKVHTSNFRIIGFSSEVALADLAQLAARSGWAGTKEAGG